MRLNRCRFGFIISLFLVSFSTVFSQEKNQITYIANEGVFIEYNGKKVLIDALHKKYSSLYHHTREPFPTHIINGNSPFEQIDLFLVTHVHGDHFDPNYTVDFLQNHKEAIFVAPRQVLDTMGKLQHLDAQIYPLDGKDSGLMYQMEGINITAIPLLHSYQKKNFWVENMAYLLDFEGLKILHIGDAEFLPENLTRIQKLAGKVDYAILPNWFFEEDTTSKLAKHLRAKKFLVVHVPRTESGLYESRLKKRVKDLGLSLNVFTRIGEFETIEGVK